MPKPTAVKYFSSTMTGAPQVHATAGTFLAMIQACLVDGFNSKSVDSAAVASNVVTLTLAAGHGFQYNQVIEVAGATPAGLNGQHRVTAAGATTVTYEVTGVSDGAATGTITAKVAGLGWIREFSAINKGVYKIDNTVYPLSVAYRLRIDDSTSSSGNNSANIIGYEAMSDVDTGTNRFPLTTQMSSGGWIGRTHDTSTTGRSWHLIGDGRRFYVQVNNYQTNEAAYVGPWCGFGEISSLKNSDPGGYMFCVAGNASTIAAQDQYGVNGLHSSNPTYMYLSRTYTGVGAAVQATIRGLFLNGASGGNPFTYPNGADNGLILTRPYVCTDSAGTPTQVRGWLPGMYHLPQFLSNRIVFDRATPYFDDNVPSFANKRVGFFTCPYNQNNWGVLAFDLTGGWD